jgi:uridylate kinase
MCNREGALVRYKRVLVKLSGGALAGSESSGFDSRCLDHIATELPKLHGMGLQLGIVVGGGNIFRVTWPLGRSKASCPLGLPGTAEGSDD